MSSQKKGRNRGEGLAACISRYGLGMNSGMWGPLVGRPEVYGCLEGKAEKPEKTIKVTVINIWGRACYTEDKAPNRSCLI